MGGLFQQLHVPRSQVAADNPVLYDDGRAVLEFYTPSHEYHGKQVVSTGAELTASVNIEQRC